MTGQRGFVAGDVCYSRGCAECGGVLSGAVSQGGDVNLLRAANSVHHQHFVPVRDPIRIEAPEVIDVVGIRQTR